MAFIKEPQPTYDELLSQFHRWVARLYQIKITCTIDDGRGNSSTTTVDRLVHRARGTPINAIDRAQDAQRWVP